MSAWKAALAVAATGLVLGFAAGAQDEGACDACFDDEEVCFAACEQSEDRDACEALCQEQSDRCLEQCE